MERSRKFRYASPAAALALLALAGCVMAPYPPGRRFADLPSYSGDGERADARVDVPLPQPDAEVVPAMPFVGAFGLAGHWNWWNWSGGRHEWVGGHWERPREGYACRPHAWEQ